ncbi:polyphosphate kinase 2 family protein [Solitalea koreensis]|uniref:Polyphosphate:AMP phosphotransferase n=1 Tax=Solitalea koreensis TaxID=543615 RepID=A0A521BZ35_9SPHI|nr:polyphosphate kinase 2 family protein [Solitalea koreensis]SMO52462.1 Polyphosphate:AMP phosphotransferase [Solitalea koreensis]
MSKLTIDKQITVTSGKGFHLNDFDCEYNAKINKEEAVTLRQDFLDRIEVLQEKMYASDNHSILMIFQARDAAGKDSTIKHVMSGVNPTGCQVVSFKVPSSNELDHDFLWRTNLHLPERGRIGIFNRSYYEEVIVTKVHPEIILNQKLPDVTSLKKIDAKFWKNRYESIRNHEKHLSDNGYVVLKFFLNVSKTEQKKRFLERIDDPEKHWKFSYADLQERKCWDQYQQAYDEMITETASEHAPWFVIPADQKWLMQLVVSKILLETMEAMDLSYPKVTDEQKELLKKAKIELESE